METFKTALSFG